VLPDNGESATCVLITGVCRGPGGDPHQRGQIFAVPGKGLFIRFSATSKRPLTDAALLGLVLEYLDFTSELPKLYVLAINELFCSFLRRVVTGAIQVDALMICSSGARIYARYSAMGPVPPTGNILPHSKRQQT
jgi:hypothetical protein